MSSQPRRLAAVVALLSALASGSGCQGASPPPAIPSPATTELPEQSDVSPDVPPPSTATESPRTEIPPMIGTDCGESAPDWKAAAEILMQEAPSRFPALGDQPITACAAVALNGQRIPYLFQLQTATWRTWAMVHDGHVAGTGAAEAQRWFSAQGADGREMNEWSVIGALIVYDALPDGFKLRPIFTPDDQASPLPWLKRSLRNANPALPPLEVERSPTALTIRLHAFDTGGMGDAGGVKADPRLRLTISLDARGTLTQTVEQWNDGRYRPRKASAR